MIDLHAHILPDVDDGPVDLEESLEMVRMGIEDGIHTICASPHLMESPNSARVNLFQERFSTLKDRVQSEGLSVHLVLGAEVYFQPDIEQTINYPTLSIDGTGRYLLVEFPMQGIPPGADKVIFNLIMRGTIPIVAHPERNLSVLKDEQVLAPFIHSGALLQINASSLEGRFGKNVKKCALSLLKKELVHFIGSDAHDTSSRPVRLQSAVAIASDAIGQERAQQLVTDNPKHVISGQPLPASNPTTSVAMEKKTFQKIWKGLTGK